MKTNLRTTAGARQPARGTEKRLTEVREFVDRLVKSGAVMILPHGHERRQHVAKLAWRGPHAVAWVDGSNAHDAHQLTFDDLRGVTKHGVYFLRDSHIVGYLSRAASVEPKHRGGGFSANGSELAALPPHPAHPHRE